MTNQTVLCFFIAEGFMPHTPPAYAHLIQAISKKHPCLDYQLCEKSTECYHLELSKRTCMAINDIMMNKKQTYTHADAYTNTHLLVMTDYRLSEGAMNPECVVLPSQERSCKTLVLDNTTQWKKNNLISTLTLTQL